MSVRKQQLVSSPGKTELHSALGAARRPLTSICTGGRIRVRHHSFAFETEAPPAPHVGSFLMDHRVVSPAHESPIVFLAVDMQRVSAKRTCLAGSSPTSVITCASTKAGEA